MELQLIRMFFRAFLDDLSSVSRPEDARELVQPWSSRHDLGEAISNAMIQEDFGLFALTENMAPEVPEWKRAQFRVTARKAKRRYEAAQNAGIPGYGVF